MAVGKNPGGKSKGGKKGSRKRVVDPFTRKEWYFVRAPKTFGFPEVGETCVTKSSGNRRASDGLKGRVYETSLAELQSRMDKGKNEAASAVQVNDFSRKFRLICEATQNDECFTAFHGYELARDRLCQIVRKNTTMIEGFCDVKTTDGFKLRFFVIGFTAHSHDPRESKVMASKPCYAKHSKVRAVRKMWSTTLQEIVSPLTLRDVVVKLIADFYPQQLTKRCRRIYPLSDVTLRKVKVIKKPKFDLTKLMEWYTKIDKAESGAGEKGKKISRPINEPAVQSSV